MKFSEAVKLIVIAASLVIAAAAAAAAAASPPAPEADASSVEASVHKTSRNLDGGPTCPGPNRRRAWRDTSCADQEAYLEAVKKLKLLDPYEENPLGIPNYDQFSILHKTWDKFAHWNNVFLQWHRWFIARFERALQIVSGSCITLPYWDWEIDSKNEGQSYVLQSSTFGSVDDISKNGKDEDCVIGGIADYRGFWKTTIANKGGCLKREFDKQEQFSGEAILMQHIAHNETFEDFDWIENAPHANIHMYIG
jgi:hypothetical protein